jgi:hypothetical protein
MHLIPDTVRAQEPTISSDLRAYAADWCERAASADLPSRAADLIDEFYAAAKLAAPHEDRLQYGPNVSISPDAYRALCAALRKARGEPS